MGMFSAKTSTYDPMSAYNPQQRKAVEMLQDLAATGTGGGITLGEQYGGDLGYYQQGQQGLAGGSALQGLMNDSLNNTGDIGAARDVYSQFAELGQFNPDDPRTGYAAFNRSLAKAGQESASAIERESAITGDRFGTAILGEKADLAENLNLQRQQRLAQTFQASQQFAALGAQGFTGLANQTAKMAGLNIDYDEYQRKLKDQEAQDKLTEFKRARKEELRRLGLAQTQMDNPLGTITTSTPSALGGLVSTALTVGGGALFGPLGAMAGGALGGAITGGGSEDIMGGGLSGLMSGGMGSLMSGGLGGLFSGGAIGGGNLPGTGMFGGTMGGVTAGEAARSATSIPTYTGIGGRFGSYA